MGQAGAFIIEHKRMRVLSGIFGIGSSFAVDLDRPFLSQTGYRSFLGIHADPMPDILPEEFASKVIAVHVEHELRGKLVPIAERYRQCTA